MKKTFGGSRVSVGLASSNGGFFFCYGGSGLTRRPRSVEMSLETGAKNRHHFHVALFTQWAEICKTM